MTVRYEANPPKIIPGVDLEHSLSEFIKKIKSISASCDAVHLTEDVLGFQRISPIKAGKMLKDKIPNLPITVSMRVRHRSLIHI